MINVKISPSDLESGAENQFVDRGASATQTRSLFGLNSDGDRGTSLMINAHHPRTTTGPYA